MGPWYFLVTQDGRLVVIATSSDKEAISLKDHGCLELSKEDCEDLYDSLKYALYRRHD